MADSQRKTANLYDGLFETGYYDNSGVLIMDDSTSRTTTYILITTNKTFTISNLWYNSAAMSNFAVYEWDENKQWLRRSSRQYPPASKTITFTVGNDCKYFTLQIQTNHPSDLMLNKGSTPLPYESYWYHSLRKLTTATEAVENPLYSDGTAITSYTIKGNTVQNGTPTPSNPVEVNGVGVRTENLFDYSDLENGSINPTDGSNMDNPNQKRAKSYMSVIGGESYCISNLPSEGAVRVHQYKQDKTYLGSNIYSSVFTTDATCAYVRISGGSGNFNPNVMLNTGTTAKPYEPYGYKIPISNGQQTTNIYLGSTQTVRQIKKLVLTGQEDWARTVNNKCYYINSAKSCPSDYLKSNIITIICSHYAGQANTSSGSNEVNEGCVCFFTGGGYELYIGERTITSATDFKTYLQQQYAAGTPVTVWYVLATEETAAVNEPLMKIGTYADTLSNAASIPTTEGANSITVGTTVQPSEFTATWTGWHDASVKEKSVNLFDYTTMADGVVGKYLNAGGTTTDDSRFTITDYIPCDTDTVTLYRGTLNNQPAICCYDENKNYITGISYNAQDPVTLTASQKFKYVRFSWKNSTHTEPDVLTRIRLNNGAYALPYEPYWK